MRARTWKESPIPTLTPLDRIEHVTTAFPDRCFAVDQFGPLSIRPHDGAGWAHATKPDRLPAPHGAPTASATSAATTASGTTSCGGVRRGKGVDHTLAALKSIRAARPDGAAVAVILDNRD